MGEHRLRSLARETPRGAAHSSPPTGVKQQPSSGASALETPPEICETRGRSGHLQKPQANPLLAESLRAALLQSGSCQNLTRRTPNLDGDDQHASSWKGQWAQPFLTREHQITSPGRLATPSSLQLKRANSLQTPKRTSGASMPPFTRAKRVSAVGWWGVGAGLRVCRGRERLLLRHIFKSLVPPK